MKAMMTLEQTIEILKERPEELGEIRAHPEGYLRTDLANTVNPAQPYTLIVHPIEEQQVLRVCVLGLGTAQRSGSFLPVLARMNSQLSVGCIGTDEDDDISYRINHVCLAQDLPWKELLDRLLDETIAIVGKLERQILYNGMIDSGIPKNRITTILKAVFTPAESAPAGEQATL
jgi:hypothetical protein